MRRYMGACILLICTLLLAACSPKPQPPKASLEVICLDVGQGACVLLRTSEGDILVDTGPEEAQATLCSRLRELGVSSLSYLILTHFDEDHIGGADAVVREFSVGEIWVNGEWEGHEAESRLWTAARARGLIPLRASASAQCQLGALVLTVLSPQNSQVRGNEGSLVLLARCDSASLLLMGDVGVETEQWLLDTYEPTTLRSDVLFVSHHGSSDGCSEEFLHTVKPSAAVISCGAGNAYGHPDGRTLARLLDVGAQIYRTDLMGDIKFCTAENGFRFYDHA